MHEDTTPSPFPPEAEREMSFQDALRYAISLHQEEEHEQAERVYLQLLALQPANPDVLHFLGVLRHHQRRSPEALELILSALSMAPEYSDAWANVGNVYRQLDRLDDSEAAYRRALEINPDHVGVLNNLATLLRVQGRFEEALEMHRRALELSPGASDVYYNFANTVKECGDPDLAIAAYRRAIELNPAHSNANQRFGYMLHRIGRVEEAIAIYRDWVAADPDNPIAAHMLAACTAERVPGRASDSFVRKTFDGFADSFDTRLLGDLSYRAPELVGAAVAAIGAADGGLDVLDAGCGTGLCAPHLRPFARSLTGIDLSAGMLEKARNRGGYDELLEVEITEFLRSSPDSFDLIASADTLVYFGALEGVAAGARDALRDGGRLVFTVERLDEGDEYQINPHGRYSHTESYVRRVLADAGFDQVSTDREVLRTEAGEDVGGLVVTARAGGHPDAASPA